MFNRETAIGRGERIQEQQHMEASARLAADMHVSQYTVLDSMNAVGNTIDALYEIVDTLEKRLTFVRESRPEEAINSARVQRGGSPLRNEIENQNNRLIELYTRLVNLNDELDL